MVLFSVPLSKERECVLVDAGLPNINKLLGLRRNRGVSVNCNEYLYISTRFLPSVK